MFNPGAMSDTSQRLFGPRARYGQIVVGLIMLVWGAALLRPAISAAEGHGTPGYFVAQSQSCNNHGNCSWSGEFRLPDGQVTRTGVGIDENDSDMVTGSVVPALDTGDTGEVFPRSGDRSWAIDLLVAVIGLAIAGHGGWQVLRLRRDNLEPAA